MTTTTSLGLAKGWRPWGGLPLVAAATLLVLLVAVSCGRKSRVAAVREQVVTTALLPTTTTTAAAGPAATSPTTLDMAYARLLEQPAWSEEAQEPLNLVVVRGTVRGTGDKFEGWFMVGDAAPV
ncbi:MAG: hypothetical protein WCH61_07030, partial [bacterium]